MKTITFTINGQRSEASLGTTVAAAVLNAGVSRFRDSASGEGRAPFCGMGLCYECRLTIDGSSNEMSCRTAVRQGMEIETDDDV